MDTSTTLRARLQGQLLGEDVRFEVEACSRGAGLGVLAARSGQPQVQAQRSVLVTPPPSYAMAPFEVLSYTHDALAATKIAAAALLPPHIAPARSPPRDGCVLVYDLRDLIWAGRRPDGVSGHSRRANIG